MLLRLGLETQQHHAVADSDRIALMDVASPRDYRLQLARIFGFEVPVEAALAPWLDSAIVRERAKAHWLRRDLTLLGLTSDDLDRAPQCSVRITSVTQALGWLWVLERHTLVSGLIRRQLVHRFGAELPASYLAAYADGPGARFRSLCEEIDLHASQQASNPTLLVGAASEAFRHQRQWYLNAPLERDTRGHVQRGDCVGTTERRALTAPLSE